MKKNRGEKQGELMIEVLATAMHWYSCNVAAGCTDGNFSGQTLLLWRACKALTRDRRQWLGV